MRGGPPGELDPGKKKKSLTGQARLYAPSEGPTIHMWEPVLATLISKELNITPSPKTYKRKTQPRPGLHRHSAHKQRLT